MRLATGCIAVAAVLSLALGGCSAPAAPSQSVPASAASSQAPATETPGTPSTPSPPPVKELPRGGTKIFPDYRLFGYSGFPGAPGQGRLGIGSLDKRMREIEQRGKAYTKGRKLMPIMELIATTVHAVPGKDGMYRTRVEESVIKKWLATARRHKAMLLLNIQPGRADFIDEVKYFEKWLKEPDVGLALDPEWAVEKGQVPGRVFGRTSGKELNEVAAYVSQLVTANNLPEKVLLYHQLHVQIVRKEKDLKPHPGVVLIKSIDGIGSPGAKIATYNMIVKKTPNYVHKGFKLFYVEDRKTGKRLMTAKEILRLKPQPEYILFE